MRFQITYNDGLLNAQDLLALLHLGGEQIGLCDWRPKFGRYRVVDDPTAPGER